MQFPVYLNIGYWQIHPHIFFESLAYAIAFRLMLKLAKKDTISAPQRASVVVGGMVGALLGAKLLVVLEHWQFISQNWHNFLLVVFQGKTVVGAILGGLIGVEISKKIIGVKRSTGDVFVYPLLVGTAVGRIGCFLTGLSDKTYGIATNLPWGVDFGDGITRHPTQLYEIVFILGLILFLRWRSRFSRNEGDLFKFYLISYLGFRFIIDFIKPDIKSIVGLSPIQFACLLAVLYYYQSIRDMFTFKKSKI